MNAVEIEEAISNLASQPFDPAEFPYAFLQAFGNKDTTIKKLRSGESNKSDLGGVLQRNNIHIVATQPGEVTQALAKLQESTATTRYKVKFILATDGTDFEAEELETGESVACAYDDFPNHFGFFLALAGISTVKQIRESSFDIRATSKLNKLYIELLKDNPEWGTVERSHEMNDFMARLIFCFFAEDTDIFSGSNVFIKTIEQMSERDSSNTHTVIAEIFRAMNTPYEARTDKKIPRWANHFPYVNGGLFSGNLDVPLFSKIARSYLLHIGSLDWTKINPDIFGSMIQAVADDEERGALGMHYTSVPNILKVLNPLFLDDLRAKLEEAGDNPRMLLNLRKRIAKIRVFDPACGSGNFLVIAYKQMREIENIINERRDERGRKSDIRLTNFRGIELRDFPAEIARLALIIAEFQCDELYLGHKQALTEFLPLESENWITCGNALRLDWLTICPPTNTGIKYHAEDLFDSPLTQLELDVENEGGETYICGNPPYLGGRGQGEEQKADLQAIFERRSKNWKSLDYVSGWFMKAAEYCRHTPAKAAFVTTNSLCQGVQVSTLWPEIFSVGCEIEFAYTSFKWSNLAAHNAGVTVAIICISTQPRSPRRLFQINESGETIERQCAYINAYLTTGKNMIVEKQSNSFGEQAEMTFGNTPIDGGNLLLSSDELKLLRLMAEQSNRLIRRIYGSAEFIKGLVRFCLWIDDNDLSLARSIPVVNQRIENVRALRLKGGKTAQDIALRSHQFQRTYFGKQQTVIVPRVSSESRPYLPVGLLDNHAIVADAAFALYDAPLWNMALIASRLHLIWIATVCGKLKTDFRYSNTLGWNTFPVPTLTDKNKADLTRCAEDILLAREAHFPATIADLYDPNHMPADLREAHERNDETLERIYIGRRFRNDTERLEKLFELYTKMVADKGASKKSKTKAGA